MPIANDLPEVLETTEPERLATGFIFTEGPLWHPDGYWYFVDLRRNQLLRLTPAAAEDHYQQALGWARRQGALSWELRAGKEPCPGNCAPPPASPGCCASKIGRQRRLRFSRRSTIGSPRASTLPISKPQRH
jgi:sugar lactone lactonase YvrE